MVTVTTLGQGIFEQIGKIIAEGAGAFAANQHDTEITINTFRLETIDSIIVAQRAPLQRGGRITSPDLEQELQQLATLNNASYQRISVKSDLYVRRMDGREEFYCFKTVKPNLDQTAEAKKNLLRLRTANDRYEAYFALPYNPAGEGNLYEVAGHSMPKKLFNMNDSRYVLIGSTLWNKIGDDPNTYNELLAIFQEVGQHTKGRIRNEYFNLET